MNKRISILLVGIGGYGSFYVKKILKSKDIYNVEIAGIVDPRPEGCSEFDKLMEMKIPVFVSVQEFYKTRSVDLVIISSPIQYHCEQACHALYNGSSVLCEKPLSATVQDAYEMIRASRESGNFLAIGYQWSYSKAIIDLKKDIISGVLGKPRRFKTLVLWPRDEKYYNRGWAGRKYDRDGKPVFDSIANNAAAHYLHNMFFLLGNKIDRSISVAEVTAELYRANNIENYDTAAVKALSENGTMVHFYASHAVKDTKGPDIALEFEKAIVKYCLDFQKSTYIRAEFTDGTEKSYGDPMKDGMNKIWDCVDALRGVTRIKCPAEAALSHTICINGMNESMPEIKNFPKELVNIDNEKKITWTEGLYETLNECFDKCVFPSEISREWGEAGGKVELGSYYKSL